MKQLFTRWLSGAALVVLLLMPAAPALAAYQIVPGTTCSQVSNSAVCDTPSMANDPLTGSTGLLHVITNLVAVVAGAAAIILIVLAGIRYITSGGDAEEVARAKKTIILASVGLIIIVLARAIINIIVSKV